MILYGVFGMFLQILFVVYIGFGNVLKVYLRALNSGQNARWIHRLLRTKQQLHLAFVKSEKQNPVIKINII